MNWLTRRATLDIMSMEIDALRSFYWEGGSDQYTALKMPSTADLKPIVFAQASDKQKRLRALRAYAAVLGH